MAASVNRTDNNHREKVQKVFIQRDYSEGTNVKFQTKFPPELEGLIDRHLFEQTINTLNRIYAEAEKTSTTTFCEGCLACLTSYIIYLCIETHYQKCLKRISAYLDDQNETVWLPRGLLITDPIERGLRVIEIAILVDSTNQTFLKMPVLLEGLTPRLSADVISKCKSIGINTVTDFVTANIEELSKETKISFKDLLCIRHDLISSKGSFPQRADSLFATLMETMHIISTGNERMNAFLKGGIYAGEVTEIHGRAGAGKTQFCMCVAASTVLDSESTVLFLNSTCDFSAERIEQILMKKCEDRQMVAEKMKRIKVINLVNIYHLLDVLDYVMCSLHTMDQEFFKQLKLIVVDSVTQIMAPCFGGKYIDGPGFMSNVARSFKLICSEHMVAMLVSNNTVWSENSNFKAGLGPNWKYVPSVSLLISKVDEMKLHRLTTAKSCRNGLYKELTFNITEAGISD